MFQINTAKDFIKMLLLLKKYLKGMFCGDACRLLLVYKKGYFGIAACMTKTMIAEHFCVVSLRQLLFFFVYLITQIFYYFVVIFAKQFLIVLYNMFIIIIIFIFVTHHTAIKEKIYVYINNNTNNNFTEKKTKVTGKMQIDLTVI